MKRLRDNNKGLSLIEVLVAITILAIVVTPFLHSFVTTANTNRKAKDIHKATVLAQSIVESCKAESLEDIAMQFDYPAEGFRIVSTDRINNGTDWRFHVKELRLNTTVSPSSPPAYLKTINYESPLIASETDKRSKVTSSIYWEGAPKKTEFLGQSNGFYYFAMENVKQDNSKYDVLIKLDASSYHGGGTTPDYNDKEFNQIPVIDDKQDALCVQKDMYRENAITKFHGEYPTVSESDIADAMKCSITVNIEKTSSGPGAYVTKVWTDYRYAYKHGTDAETYYPKTQHNFDSSETGMDLRNVYLYYYPLYDHSATRDVITINNPSAVPVDFYLFKQYRNGPPPAPVTTETQESDYRLNLLFNEAGATETNVQTRLHSNLKQNVANGTPLSTTGRVEVKLNGSLVNLDTISVPNVLDVEASNRIFDLEVSIYELGAAGANFPAGVLLATMEGTKLK